MEYVEHQGASVVLLGNVNPAIFNPDWLCRQGIISAAEAGDARVDVIHPEVSQFVVGDLSFDITQDHFTLMAAAEPFVRISDIVAEIFKVALAHTPLNALGINYYAHFRVRDWHQQRALGRELAPSKPWGEWGNTFDGDSLETVGGLLNLTMQQANPGDRASGNIKAIIQPSRKIESGQGVYVQVNDHYEKPANGDPVDFAEICLDRMTPSLERARGIVAHLSELARSF